MASASDVPNRFDVVINSQGYRFADALQQSLAYRNNRAFYGYSPTFLERSNIQGDYGDNQQAFWMTVTQRDWSYGEDQNYYRANDPVGFARFYKGTNVDLGVAGQITQTPSVTSVTLPSLVRSGQQAHVGDVINDTVYISSSASSTLFKVSNTGSVTSIATGGSTAPITTTMDRNYVYSSDGNTLRKGTVSGASWSNFNSSIAATALAYLNNTVYGFLEGSDSTLYRWDTSGAQTALYTFKDGTGGNELLGNPSPLPYGLVIAYGGRLVALTWRGLYQYDGTGLSQLANFPNEFIPTSIVKYGEDIFIGGVIQIGTTKVRQCIFVYSGGQLNVLWQSRTDITGSGSNYVVHMAAYRNGIVFTDTNNGVIRYYNSQTGGISSILSHAPAGAMIVAAKSFFLVVDPASTTAYQYPSASVTASSTITTSLYDLDSSLTKYMKGVTIDADLPTGATIDLSYFTNTIPYTSTTSIVTGASVGHEYSIGTNARSIGFVVTLNKGSSTSGPVFKRLYLRAAPILQSYRRAEYMLDLSGVDGTQMLKLRDGTNHVKDGMAMAADLATAATATTPFSITDRIGTFTGIIEPDQLEIREIRPGEFIARVVVRET